MGSKSGLGGILAIVALVTAMPPVHAQPADNAAIVELHQAGLGSEAIVAKLRTSPCTWDTSPRALVALKRAGVPEPAIVAMIERCAGSAQAAAPSLASRMRAPGIYLAEGSGAGERLTRLRPAAQSSTKVTGNGSVLFPHMLKLIVPQPAAQTATANPRPVFYFHFDPDSASVGEFGEAESDAAQSPNEFSLVHFRRSDGNRQVPIGRAQPYVEVSGIDPKNTLPFVVGELGRGAFKVEVSQQLEPGEYGFVLLGERRRRAGTVFRIYDFSVTGPAPRL